MLSLKNEAPAALFSSLNLQSSKRHFLHFFYYQILYPVQDNVGLHLTNKFTNIRLDWKTKCDECKNYGTNKHKKFICFWCTWIFQTLKSARISKFYLFFYNNTTIHYNHFWKNRVTLSSMFLTSRSCILSSTCRYINN